MSYLSYSKSFQGVADVFLRKPDRYGPLLQFIESVMVGPSALTQAEREIIAAHVSKLNGCDFCVGAHNATLAALDIDFHALDATASGPDTRNVSAKLQTILDFATRMTREPDSIRQSDINALRDAGWEDETIEDAINVTALFNYVNRLVDAFGIEGDDAYFKHVGATLATRGYAPLIKSTLRKAS